MEKVAVVTGANRGLGLGTSKALAAQGYNVVMVGRNEDKIKQAADSLAQEGRSVEAFVADVTDDRAVKELGSHIENKFGHLDVLINNAGVVIEGKVDDPEFPSFTRVPADTILQTININTIGPIRLIQELMPLLKQSTAARIVNVSSGMGQLSEMDKGFPGYRLSKTALNAVTAAINAELERVPNIKINSVCPGWVRTDMGGPNATRAIEEGISGIVWAATLPDDGPSGGFFRDGKTLDW